MLATQNEAQPDTWGFFRPLASLPSGVRFSSDELAVLFATKDNDTFNAVVSLDELHASHLANLQLYSERRHAFTEQLPGGNLVGMIGDHHLSAEEFARLAPMAKQLDMLVSDIAISLELHVKETAAALLQLNRAIAANLGMKIKVDLPSDA